MGTVNSNERQIGFRTDAVAAVVPKWPPPERQNIWKRVFSADTLAPIFLGLTVVYLGTRCVLEAMARPFWYDELNTWSVAAQPSLGAVWKVLSASIDTQPPAYYLLVRFCTRLPVTPELSYRLPSVLGFLASIVFMYLFAIRYTDAVCALLCALLLIPTPLYHNFSVEARPYALLVGLLSFAVLCYDRVPTPRWTLLFGFALFLTECIHYYGVFMFFPFMLAEVVFTVLEKRVRWTVWGAFAVGYLPLGACWTLLSHNRSFYGASVWTQHGFLEAIRDYGWLFHAKSTGISVLVISLPMTLLLALAVRAAAESGKQELVEECFLAFGFLATPIVLFVASKVLHSTLAYRYVISSLLAFPVTIALGFKHWKREGIAAALIGLLSCVVLVQERAYFAGAPQGHLVNPSLAVEQLWRRTNHSDLPLMVSRAHDFLPLFYYSRGELRDRLIRSTDVNDAIRFDGSDSAERQLELLKDVIGLKEPRFEDFAAHSPIFLLFFSTEGWDVDWWPRVLEERGFSLQELATEGKKKIFLVRRRSG